MHIRLTHWLVLAILPLVSHAGALKLTERESDELELYDSVAVLSDVDASVAWAAVRRGESVPGQWQNSLHQWFWALSAQPSLARFTLNTPDTESLATHALLIRNASVQNLQLVVVAGNEVRQHLAFGANLPHPQRPVHHQYFVLPLNLQPGAVHSVYLYGPRVDIAMATSAARIVNLDHYLIHQSPEEYTRVSYMMGLLAMIAVLLGLGLLGQPRRDYLLALLYVAFANALLASQEGMLFAWLGLEHAWWYTDGSRFAVMLLSASVIGFTRLLFGIHGWRGLTAGVTLVTIGLCVLAAITSLPPIQASGIMVVSAIPWVMVSYALLGLCALRSIMKGGLRQRLNSLLWLVYFGAGIAQLILPFSPWADISMTELTHALLALTALFMYQSVVYESFQRQKQLIESGAANQTRVDFIAKLSHEIRTPLNAVIGMTETLRLTKLDTKQRYYADVIANAGDTLLQLVNNVLDFAKLRSDGFSLSFAPFKLDHALISASKNFAHDIFARHLGAFVVIDPDVPLRVISDELRLRQVVTNLVANACRYTEKGHVQVRVGCVETQDNRATLRVQVQDSGRGIASDRLSSLFNEFSQALDERSGTGLGLAICRMLVNANGGRIDVQSTLGEGTTVSFTWPVQVDHVEETRMRRSWGQLQGKRVLFCTSRPTVAQILLPHLRVLGATVELAESAEEAARVLDKAPYDMLLLEGIVTLKASSAPARALLERRLPTLYFVSGESEHPDADVRPWTRVDYVPAPVSEQIDAVLAQLSGAKANATEPSTEPTLPGISRRILLVDDNSVNLQVGKQLLLSLGAEVVAVSSGQEALQAAAHLEFDLVLMDCEMPDMDGFETTQGLLRQSPSPPPIVALTAHATEAVALRCQQVGMQSVLHKPVRRDVLAALLTSLNSRCTH